MAADEEKLKRAFINPKYTWRTIRGISKETGLSNEVIQSYVASHGGVIVKSSSRNARGEQLFASREVYRSKASPFRRISAALKNRGG